METAEKINVKAYTLRLCELYTYLKEYHLTKYYCQRNMGLYVQHRTSYSTPEPHYCTPDGFAINDELAKSMLMELKISSHFSWKKLTCTEVQCQYTIHLRLEQSNDLSITGNESRFGTHSTQPKRRATFVRTRTKFLG